MVATQLRHVDDPDRPPQSPIPPLCEAQPHLHATLPCPRSFARAAICGGGAVGLCIAVQPCSRSFACAAISKMQPRATSTPNRPEPPPLSPAENRCYAAPRPHAGGRSSTPSRKALSSTPPRRQPATRPPTPLTFGAQPTAPSLAHCQRPALPTVNTPRLPNLPPPSGAPRHKRRGIRSAASTEVPKPVGTPRRIPNRQRASRRRSPEHRHAPSQAPSRLNRASGSSALPGRRRLDILSPNERPQPSHPPPPSSDAPPYASSPEWPPWSTLVANGCSFSVSMRTNPTISSGTTYRKMGTSASE